MFKVQMVIQGRWLFSNDPLLTSVLILPHLDLPHIPALKRICNTNHTPSLLELISSVGGKMEKLSKELSDDLEPTKMEEVSNAVINYVPNFFFKWDNFRGRRCLKFF